tara:strand:- start:3323 stop:4192 length:870 start_codon:yes stop_codon:yes gene_type:complete
MAFVPSTTFAGGNVLEAPQLTGNQSGARDYINSGTATADLAVDTFDTQDLALGRPVLVTLDHEFTTGDVMIQNDLSTIETARRYVAGTAKKPSITRSPMDANLTTVDKYWSIPGAGRRFFLDEQSDVVTEVMGFAMGHVTNQVRVPDLATRAYFARTTPDPGAVDSRLYLAIDGVVKFNTVCFVFAEDKDFNAVTPGTNYPSAQSRLHEYRLGGGHQSTGGYPEESALRRPLYFFWAEPNLSAGWHTIQIVADPRYERMFVSALSMQIEVLASGGRTTWDGDDYLVFKS